MIAYLASKREFLSHGGDVADVVREQVEANLGIKLALNSAEFRSWSNSLGNALFHALRSDRVPDDAGVAIEYQIRERRLRADVIVSGYGADGSAQLIIIELKQWAEIEPSPLPAHVRTYVGKGMRDERHPAYQAWSYRSILSNFYSVIEEKPVEVSACAYLHNCEDGSALQDARNEGDWIEAPVFLRGPSERERLVDFIAERIVTGDDGAILREVDASVIRPGTKLVDALVGMVDGNPAFELVDEQKTAFETILTLAATTGSDEHRVLIIEGGPGTGKTVVAINALARLSKSAGPTDERMNCRYVTKNAAPRQTYVERLRAGRVDPGIIGLFVNSDAFGSADKHEYDVVLVDEAHRLTLRGRFGKADEDLPEQLIKSSRVSVFFLDETQHVTWKDVGTRASIEERAKRLGATVGVLRLSAQFRCAASDEYLRWLNQVFGLQGDDYSAADLSECDYDIRVVDSPSALRELIEEKDRTVGSARLLAGFCWEWPSSDPDTRSEFDIEFPEHDFAMRWNVTDEGMDWMERPGSVSEVGCIHTAQGLEGSYMGVIIGRDLAVDDGRLTGRPEGRAKKDQSLKGYKKAMKEEGPAAAARAGELVRKTYRTLLTRGMRGTFIYCEDPNVAGFLRQSLVDAGYRSQEGARGPE